MPRSGSGWPVRPRVGTACAGEPVRKGRRWGSCASAHRPIPLVADALGPHPSLPRFAGEGTHELPPHLARRWDSRTPSPVRAFCGRGRAGWGFGFAGLSEAAGAALRARVRLAVRVAFWAAATFFWPEPHRRRIPAPSRRGRRQPTGEISCR